MTNEPRSVMCIDKIALRLDKKYLNLDHKREYEKQRDEKSSNPKGITGINLMFKNHYEINIHVDDIGTMADEDNTLDFLQSQLYRLYEAEKQLLIVEPTKDFILNNMKLVEYELAYDFYNFKPFYYNSKHLWNIHKNSRYTQDYRKYTKNTHPSLIIIYDSGLKEGLTETKVRLEYRFQKNYIKGLELKNLDQSFNDLYLKTLFPVIVSKTRKLITVDMIFYNIEMLLKTKSPFLHVINNLRNMNLANIHSSLLNPPKQDLIELELPEYLVKK